jgi:hypothetical protein
MIDKSVHHNDDRDLYTALKGLYEKLKDFGYGNKDKIK